MPTKVTCEADRETSAAELYLEHSVDLRRLLVGLLRNQADADDALQHVFLKLLDNWTSVDVSRAKSWLFTVAYREAMTIRRRQNVDGRVLAQLWARPVWQESSSTETPRDQAIREEETQAVRRVLDSLPQNQRDVIDGKVFGGKTFAKIAEESGIPLGTVLTRMRLALKKLRELVED